MYWDAVDVAAFVSIFLYVNKVVVFMAVSWVFGGFGRRGGSVMGF